MAIVPVLSNLPNLILELSIRLPQFTFHKVTDPVKDAHFKVSPILICDFDLLAPHLYNLPETEWIQGTWAGVDSLTPFLDNSKILPYKITRFTGKHFGQLMGEYVMANIINYERDFFKVKDNQRNCLWNQDEKIAKYRAVNELTVGILGLGNIGGRIGQMLNFMGAKILAYGRRPNLPSSGDFKFVTEYFTGNNLGKLLNASNYVVNVLPKTPETDKILDNDILENCKEKETVLINIGRGNVISEDSLIKALNNKWISGAILDVFNEEPLPSDCPLWKMPQVFITPHIAGLSRAKDVVEQIVENLHRYQNKLPLLGIFDPVKGY